MDRPLDRIDEQILSLVQQDGRISNKALAAAVGLAPSSCLERVRRLTEQNIIRATRAVVDPAAVGVQIQAMVAVRMRSHDSDSWASLRAALDEREEVVGIFQVSGADDLLLHVACRNTEHLRSLIYEGLSGHAAVRNVETSLIFEQKTKALPVYS